MRRLFGNLILLGVLAGCASTGVGPTIGDLPKRKIALEEPTLSSVQREEVIRSYKLFLESAEGGPLYPEAMRRLADLQLELGEEAATEAQQTVQAAARQSLETAIDIYTTYLTTYPNRKDNDLILYQLAKAYSLNGDLDKALQTMNRLVTEFPDTEYLEEIQFRRGEILFMLRNYAAAADAYRVIVERFPDSLFLEKALYKLGWAEFKQEHYDRAIDTFIALLDRKYDQGALRARSLSPEINRGEQELIEDTLRAISLSFANQEGAESIRKYFAGVGNRQYGPLLYRKLGELYIHQDRILDAANVFMAFVKGNPDSPLAPEFHTDAIDAYTRGNFPKLVLQAKEEFVKRYGVDTRFWQAQDEAAREKIKPLLARHIRELATHYHAVAKKTGKPADFQRAAGWYRLYLSSFPRDKDAPQMHFLMAEAFYDARQYATAIDAYEATAYDYPRHAKSAEAGYAALVAYEDIKQILRQRAKQKKGAEEATLYDPRIWQERAIVSALRFADTFPEHKQVPAVLARTAEELFALKDYPRAISTAQKLLARQDIAQQPKLKRVALVVLGHSRFELGRYAEAEQAYRAVLKTMSPKDKQYAGIYDRLAASIYKQGEAERNKGAWQLAATHFLRVGQVTPASSLRAVAQYDAATMYIKLGNWPQATQLLEDFRKRFPGHKLQQGVTEKLAVAYTETGQGAKAAREMLALAAASPDPNYRREVMLQAAALYDKAGQPEKAVQVYKDYVKKYPAPLEPAIEARHFIAEYYRKRNDAKQWGYWLNEIIRADARGGKQRTARTAYLAARATLLLAKPYQQAYARVKLTIPLKKSLKKKKQLMQTALKAYQRAMQYKVAEVTTEATYRIAEIYNDFAKALMASQRPRGLSADELEQYDILLEEQAYPFEEKAIDIHLANARRTRDEIWDEWVQRSLAVLAKIQPIRYGKQEIIEPYAEITP